MGMPLWKINFSVWTSRKGAPQLAGPYRSYVGTTTTKLPAFCVSLHTFILFLIFAVIIRRPILARTSIASKLPHVQLGLLPVASNSSIGDPNRFNNPTLNEQQYEERQKKHDMGYDFMDTLLDTEIEQQGSKSILYGFCHMLAYFAFADMICTC
eukprot:12418381-Karenia_brevis.AAC.1